MTTICTIMRMEDGILLRISEIKKLENAVTKVKAMPITRAFLIEMVTANAEQMPKTCTAMGLFLKWGW